MYKCVTNQHLGIQELTIAATADVITFTLHY